MLSIIVLVAAVVVAFFSRFNGCCWWCSWSLVACDVLQVANELQLAVSAVIICSHLGCSLIVVVVVDFLEEKHKHQALLYTLKEHRCFFLWLWSQHGRNPSLQNHAYATTMLAEALTKQHNNPNKLKQTTLPALKKMT